LRELFGGEEGVSGGHTIRPSKGTVLKNGSHKYAAVSVDRSADFDCTAPPEPL